MGTPAETVFRSLDANADGRISLAEFSRGFDLYSGVLAAERQMLGASVDCLLGRFAQLCAERGCPIHEARVHGTGEYASERLPLVYDINQSVLLEATASTVCSRDGRPGSALVDLLEALGGTVGRAKLMLSYTWGYELHAILAALESYCVSTSRERDASRTTRRRQLVAEAAARHRGGGAALCGSGVSPARALALEEGCPIYLGPVQLFCAHD